MSAPDPDLQHLRITRHSQTNCNKFSTAIKITGRELDYGFCGEFEIQREVTWKRLTLMIFVIKHTVETTPNVPVATNINSKNIFAMLRTRSTAARPLASGHTTQLRWGNIRGAVVWYGNSLSAEHQRSTG
jgi:hypothetical protein